MVADPPDLNDAEIDELQSLLDRVATPLQPMDTSALDGYLCGVLLQPRPPAEAQWMPPILDLEGRPPPPGSVPPRLAQLVQRRHAELGRAIAARNWFDPWIYESDDSAALPAQAMLPWVAGFAAALERFPALLATGDPALTEPLAVLYAAFDPSDLEDAGELLEEIESLEPPADLAEAAEDIVGSVLRIADVSRPRPARAAAPGRRRLPAAHPRTKRRCT